MPQGFEVVSIITLTLWNLSRWALETGQQVSKAKEQRTGRNLLKVLKQNPGRNEKHSQVCRMPAHTVPGQHHAGC